MLSPSKPVLSLSKGTNRPNYFVSPSPVSIRARNSRSESRNAVVSALAFHVFVQWFCSSSRLHAGLAAAAPNACSQ